MDSGSAPAVETRNLGIVTALIWGSCCLTIGGLLLHWRSAASEVVLRRPPIALRVDLNVAPVEELSLLPGIGRQLAERIVEHRKRIGFLSGLDSLAGVPGLGPKKLAAIAPFLDWSLLPAEAASLPLEPAPTSLDP